MNNYTSIPVFREQDFIAYNGRFWLGIKQVRSYLGLPTATALTSTEQELLRPFVAYPDEIPFAKDEVFLVDLFGAYLFSLLVDSDHSPRLMHELGRFIVNSKANRNKAIALRYELATLEEQIEKKRATLAAEKLRTKIHKKEGVSLRTVRRMEELTEVLSKEELASMFGFPIQQITRMVNLLKQSEGRAA